MTPARFADLAGAYGGQLDRWPEAEQEAAHALLSAYPELRDVIEREASLDLVLATWSAQADPAGRPVTWQVARRVVERSDRLRRARFWLSGLSATGALAAGAAAGMLAVSLSGPPQGEGGASVYGLTILGAPLDETASPR